MNTDDDGHLKLEKYVQLSFSKALVDIGDRPLTQIQKYMFNLGKNAYRLRRNETSPLLGFLSSVAVEAWLSGAVDEQPFDESAVAAAHQAILQVAKLAILNRELEVLEMASLAPMNDTDRVRSWCLSSSSEELGGTIDGLVVREEAACQWLKKEKLFVPERLRVDPRAIPETSQTVLEKGTIEEPSEQRRVRIFNRVSSLEAGGTRNYLGVVAKEEGLSISRIKQLRDEGAALLAKDKNPSKAPDWLSAPVQRPGALDDE